MRRKKAARQDDDTAVSSLIIDADGVMVELAELYAEWFSQGPATASGTTDEADGHRPKRGEHGRPLYWCRDGAGKSFREHGRPRNAHSHLRLASGVPRAAGPQGVCAVRRKRAARQDDDTAVSSRIIEADRVMGKLAERFAEWFSQGR